VADNTKVFSVAEFQSIPLDFIVAAPLTAVVNAQKLAAIATRDFVTAFAAQSVSFSFKNATTDATGKTATEDVNLNVPLLSMVPTPHMRFDSFSVHFLYEVTQTAKEESSKSAAATLSAGAGAVLSPWVSASLQGSVSSKSASELTTNRSGTLEITLHASEAPMPEGLSRLLGILANSIRVASPGAASGQAAPVTTPPT
jgi:hypothetical protein